MQHYNLNKNFINQFRQEAIPYPSTEAQQYQQFYFRQLAGEKNEISFLGKFFAEKLSDSRTLDCLTARLKHENRQNHIWLSRLVHNLEEVLSSYIQDEPYTSGYYHVLLAILEPFSTLINGFRKEAQENLLKKLNAISYTHEVGCNETGFIGSDDVDDMIIVIEEYLDEIKIYYDDFSAFLYEESKDTRGVTVTTLMEQSLLDLISLIEKLILATESTQASLKSWKIQLAKRETQEIYN